MVNIEIKFLMREITVPKHTPLPKNVNTSGTVLFEWAQQNVSSIYSKSLNVLMKSIHRQLRGVLSIHSMRIT